MKHKIGQLRFLNSFTTDVVGGTYRDNKSEVIYLSLCR